MSDDPLRWVVTGAPRSGTTWVAHLLDHAGLRTGHEHTIRQLGDDPYRVRYSNRNIPGESSYLAAAYAAQLRRAGTVIVHLIRPPLDTIGSMWGHGLKLDAINDFGDAVRLFAPRVFDHDILPRRYAQFWLDWNDLVGVHCDMLWRLHEIRAEHVEALAALVGHRTFWAEPFNRIGVPNPGAHPNTVTREDVGDELWIQLVETADRYGVPMTARRHDDEEPGHDPEGCPYCPTAQVVRVNQAHEPRSQHGE